MHQNRKIIIHQSAATEATYLFVEPSLPLATKLVMYFSPGTALTVHTYERAALAPGSMVPCEMFWLTDAPVTVPEIVTGMLPVLCRFMENSQTLVSVRAFERLTLSIVISIFLEAIEPD